MKHSFKMGGAILLLLIVGIVGCEFFTQNDRHDPAAPNIEGIDAINATYGTEAGNPAPYQAGSMAGIEILADFSGKHRDGYDWGTWMVVAEWRNEPRSTIASAPHQYFSIDDDGVGRAYLPASFLDAVFADAAERYQSSGDTSTWHQSPGLYLHILPVGDADDNYDLDPDRPDGWTWELNSWSFGGSLEALVNALGSGWWPGLPALTNVAVLVDIGDPLGIEEQRPPSSDTTTTTPFTLTSIAVSGGELLDAYKCEAKVMGAEASIPLAWSGVPASAGSLAIIMHHYPDPTDTSNISYYLVLWDIAPSVTEIAHGAADDGPWYMGANKDGKLSYTSPCSPSPGAHAYTITIYALSETPATLPAVSSTTITGDDLKTAIATVTTIDTATLDFDSVTD